MQDENRENSQQLPLGDLRQEIRQLATEVVRVNEGMEQVKSEAKRARAGAEQNQNDLRLHARRTKALWVIIILLGAALVGASWYGYPKLAQHTAQIGELPGMQSLIDSAHDRIGDAEEMLSAMAEETLSAMETERNNFNKRMARVEKSVAANLLIAQDGVRQAVTQVEQRLRAELSNSIEAVQVRLAETESAQDADRAKLAQLQNEIINVREQVAGVRREAAEQAVMAREETSRNFSQRDRQLASNRTDLDAIADRLDRRRIDFELPVQRTQELIPDVHLTVSQATVSRQRVDGWLQVDGRILWLRDQVIQRPVVFYTQHDPRPHEIVLTRVSGNDVAGYLLAPYETAVAGDLQAVQSVP